MPSFLKQICIYSVILSEAKNLMHHRATIGLKRNSPLDRRPRFAALLLKAIFALALALSLTTLPSHAQLTNLLQTPSSTTSTSSTDPLGRSTPQSTLLSFLRAAQSGDYSIAAQYLQMTAARRQSEGEQLANQLAFV